MQRPIVGIPCCHKMIAPHPFHAVGDKYIRAITDGAGCLPLLIPLLGDSLPPAAYLDRIDGLLLTGSPSNVEPWHYGDRQDDPAMATDQRRDLTTLPLIDAALARGTPMLAICRGLQELNVVLGGSLHRRLHEVPGRMSHALGEAHPIEDQYAPAHTVTLRPGGRLARLLGTGSLTVNSIHTQGIDRLAPGLTEEASAPDGQIEAVSVTDANGFALAVQWHPEWKFWTDAQSTLLFEAFGDAVRAGRPAARSAA